MRVDTAFYTIASTPYGGRGAVARQTIPKGTVILETTGPYAGVIFRKFRREVCGECFTYAFENGKNKWSIRLEDDEGGSGGAALWFCCTECRELWISERLCNGDITWVVDLYRTLERLVDQINKAGRKKRRPLNLNPLAELDDVSKDQITEAFLEDSWKRAEALSGHDSHREWMEELNEFELDTARYVLDGLVRKVSEDFRPTVKEELGPQTTGIWEDFSELQDNEHPFLLESPYLLSSHIKTYRFLRHICSMLKRNKHISPSQRATDQLATYLETSTHARSLLSRDPGNVFGIWDMALEGQESEMLGWGAFTFASYFNHSCSPNIKKHREKRKLIFHTLRDIQPGEELCISYTDETVPLIERRRLLNRNWFFHCSCAKCTAEDTSTTLS